MAQTRHLVLGLMPRGADPDTHWAAGPWCFDTEEDFFPGWEDSFVFGREPLRDPATLDRAVLMAQSLAVDSIPALGRHLLGLQHRRAVENAPVPSLLGPEKVDLPGVYWETLLAPWACTVARQLVERWLRVRALVEDWGHLPLHVELLPEDCAFAFATEHDFVMSGALGADWNTWLMSRLLEAVWPERWTRSYALPVCASYGQPIPPEDSGGLKQRLRAWARSWVLRLPCPPLRGMRLHQALRYSLALLHPSRQPDASRPLAAHFGSAATGVKHDLPLDPLPFFIGALPQTLAELDHPGHIPGACPARARGFGPCPRGYPLPPAAGHLARPRPPAHVRPARRQCGPGALPVRDAPRGIQPACLRHLGLEPLRCHGRRYGRAVPAPALSPAGHYGRPVARR